MKQSLTASAFTLATLMMGFPAQAAFQSQTLFRFSDGDSARMIETLPAVTAEEYKIFIPGDREPYKLKNAALMYDKRNPLPTLLMVGANYAFFTGGVMATVSEDGSLLYKGKTSFQPKSLGGNYFVNGGSNEVIAIDSAGFYNSTGITANNVRLFGGNFYIDQTGVMTTIKHMGTAPGNPLGMITIKQGFNFSDVIRSGGNYMLKVDGTIVGVASETGFFTMPQKVDSAPKYIGGNYFIGEDKVLYTVSDTGEVKKQLPVMGEMKVFGYSYMIDQDGDFIFVDGKGVPHTELVRVSTTGIKSKLVHQIKGKLDSHQNFIPSIQ